MGRVVGRRLDLDDDRLDLICDALARVVRDDLAIVTDAERHTGREVVACLAALHAVLPQLKSLGRGHHGVDGEDGREAGRRG